MAHHTRTPVLAPFPGPPSPSPKTRAPPPRALFTNCTFFAQFRLPPPLPTPIHPKDGRRRGIVSPRHTTNPFSPSPFSLSLSPFHTLVHGLSPSVPKDFQPISPLIALASQHRMFVLSYYTILYYIAAAIRVSFSLPPRVGSPSLFRPPLLELSRAQNPLPPPPPPPPPSFKHPHPYFCAANSVSPRLPGNHACVGGRACVFRVANSSERLCPRKWEGEEEGEGRSRDDFRVILREYVQGRGKREVWDDG